MGTVSFGQNIWWMLPAFTAAALLTWWTYRRTVPRLTGVFQWLLPLLRLSSLAIVILLLLEPLLSSDRTIETPPTTAVLIDLSESLFVTSAGEDRDSIAGALRTDLERLQLDAFDDVRLFGFGTDLTAVSATGSWIDSLSIADQRTDISRALTRVSTELTNEHLRSVVVISDGRHNTGRNPLFVAERYPVPIITAVLGDTTARRDLYVRSLATNEIGYVESEQPVRALIRSEGISAGEVAVLLSVDGIEVQRTQIDLQPDTEQQIDLGFVPDTPGLKRVEVSVSRVDGEVTYRNNSESAAVQVLDSRRRVLLLGSSPGPDVSSVRQILDADPNIDLTWTIHREGEVYYGDPMPDDYDVFDVVVLAGFPGRSTPAASASRVAQRLGESTNVLFLLGHDTDLGKLNRYFAGVLPATVGAVRREFIEASVSVSGTGSAHPILESLDLTETDWDRLPPLRASTSRWTPAPDAQVLATTRIRGVGLPDPLLTVQQRLDQRSAAVLVTGTWRWKNLSEDLSAYENVWVDLVANTVAWLTAGGDDRLVRIRPVETSFAGSDPIRFTGQVYDESLQPVPDAAVEVVIVAPGGERYPFTMDAAGNGLYNLETESLPAGSYEYQARAVRNGAELGREEGSFVVGNLSLEFKNTRADPVLMRQIAQRSGGVAISADRLTEVPRILDSLGATQSRFETSTRELELWRRYVFLAIVVVLLTAEWFLRKRSGLV